jgi:uncharacterized membrane protein YjjB (DUF3815 family)
MDAASSDPSDGQLLYFGAGLFLGALVSVPIFFAVRWGVRQFMRLFRGRSRRAIGWSAILLGWLGVHRFKLGNKKEGYITLGVTVASILPLFPGGLIMFVIGVIEGVKYLRLSDEEFEVRYRSGLRKWL